MISCNSEIGKLKSLIIHTPDEGIDRISPKHAEELLFDDIVYYPLMLKEYQIYERVLQLCLGEQNVHQVKQLLEESLSQESEEKDELITKILIEEELPLSEKTYLEKLQSNTLADILVTGYDPIRDIILFDPIPNFMFTRDIAVTVNDGIIITKAAKSARWRENLLTRMVITTHPIFAESRNLGKVINLNKPELFPPSKYGERVSVEGGDVMMIHEDYLLVGVSERSTLHGFNLLKDSLHKIGLVKNVVKINIPKDRSCMHIDTIFTQVDKTDIVCFKPIVYDGLGSNVEVYNTDGSIKIYASVKDFFHKEIDPEMNFIFAGGGYSPYQDREQWTDGCNLLTIKPGVAISYDRNQLTGKEFEKAGYTVISAIDFIEKYKSMDNPLDSIEKMIIALPSAELSRARGGSHCMSMPLLRESL